MNEATKEIPYKGVFGVPDTAPDGDVQINESIEHDEESSTGQRR